MKTIIPLAGLGKRLRPHTYARPKPLVHVAGKPILGHILDQLQPYNLEEFVFVIGYLGDQIKDYYRANYSTKATFMEQTDLNGQAGAVYLAKKYIKEDAFIVFGDTLFDHKDILMPTLNSLVEDGIIYVKEVKDPRRFGVVVVDNQNQVTQLLEKPQNPPSNLVGVGLYYIKHMEPLYEAIELLISKKQNNGELYLMDAFSMLLSNGTKFTTSKICSWLDCGTRESLLETNRTLLMQKSTLEGELNGSYIIEPVCIEKGASVVNSVVGPYVSIGKEAEIVDSRLENCIINPGAKVHKAILEDSIIGNNANVKLKSQKLDVGDDCQIGF